MAQAKKTARIRTFRDLIAWQRGMDVARAIYRTTEAMPSGERFGLTSQMRRAACSVPMNIAEGFGRHTRPEFVHGLRVAMGSPNELSTAYELATTLDMLRPNHKVLELLAEEDRLLQALIMRLEEKTEQERAAGKPRRRS